MVAAMLPAWVPLAEERTAPAQWAQEAPERQDGSAASSSDEEDTAAAPEQTASQGNTPRGGWGTRMGRTPPLPPSAAPSTSDAATLAGLAGGTADESGAKGPPMGGLSSSTYCRGRHVVVAAPLWPRLCEADPDLPAELLRAGVFVHLVAEFTIVRLHR